MIYILLLFADFDKTYIMKSLFWFC